MKKQLQSDIADNFKDDNVDSDIDFCPIGGIIPLMKVQLKDWSFGTKEKDPYKAPEQLTPCLQGNVFGHPNKKHHDGKFISTSRIIGKRNSLVVTQSGTEYELLEVDPLYEQTYPNARERLFAALKEV